MQGNDVEAEDEVPVKEQQQTAVQNLGDIDRNVLREAERFRENWRL